MPYIYSNERLMEQLYELLSSSDKRIVVYVYRVTDGKRVAPYLYKTRPFKNLEQFIAEEFGSGHYYLMFRRGEEMLLAGEIGVLLPKNHPRNR